MHIYSTIVCYSGNIIQFRLRDREVNRFRVCPIFTVNAKKVEFDKDFKEAYPNIQMDDCNGDEFATIVRYISQYKE